MIMDETRGQKHIFLSTVGLNIEPGLRTWGRGAARAAGGRGAGASLTAPLISGTDRSLWTARPGQNKFIL